MLAVGLGREFETVISCEAEGERILLVTMCEEYHLSVFLHRSDEHIKREIRDSEFARSQAGCIMVSIAVEIKRGGLRDTGGIGDTKHLEVIILVQPVPGYRFAEPQLDIPVKFEDTVRRERFAEENRRARIFSAAYNRRRLGHKP